jgi:hypothetical protein
LFATVNKKTARFFAAVAALGSLAAKKFGVPRYAAGLAEAGTPNEFLQFPFEFLFSPRSSAFLAYSALKRISVGYRSSERNPRTASLWR